MNDIFVNFVEFLLTCDVTTECEGYECGTGFCGGDCPNTCTSNEICSGNSCECDVENECNDKECGIGFCGGDCPNTCDADESCYENTCGCTLPGFVLFAGNCINCPATFENCIDCTPTACTYCSNNYHLEDGQCVLDTVFGYDNFSQYNFLIESSLSDSSDSSYPSIIKMPDFFFSPNYSNNFKGADNYEQSIESCSNILSAWLLMSVPILFVFI